MKKGLIYLVILIGVFSISLIYSGEIGYCNPNLPGSQGCSLSSTTTTSSGGAGSNVTSVTSGDTCILISPTTGAVIVTLNSSCSGSGNLTWTQSYANGLYYGILNPSNYINITSGQFFNDTSLILSVNTTRNIQNLGFYNTSQVNTNILGNVSGGTNYTNGTGLLLNNFQFNLSTVYTDTLYYSILNPSSFINITSGQMFNDTSLILSVNTTSNIQSLGFYNFTQIDDLIPSELTYYFWDVLSTVNSSYAVMNTSISPTATNKTAAGLTNGQVIVYRINKDTNLTGLTGGSLRLHTSATKTAGTKDLAIRGVLAKRTIGGVITDIETTDTSPILVNNQFTNINLFATVAAQNLNVTDMLLWRLEAVVTGAGTNPTVVITVGGTTQNGLSLPVSVSDITLNENDPIFTAWNSTFLYNYNQTIPAQKYSDANLSNYYTKSQADANYSSIIWGYNQTVLYTNGSFISLVGTQFNLSLDAQQWLYNQTVASPFSYNHTTIANAYTNTNINSNLTLINSNILLNDSELRIYTNTNINGNRTLINSYILANYSSSLIYTNTNINGNLTLINSNILLNNSELKAYANTNILGNVTTFNNMWQSGANLIFNSSQVRVGIGLAAPSYSFEINNRTKALNISNLLFANGTQFRLASTGGLTSSPYLFEIENNLRSMNVSGNLYVNGSAVSIGTSNFRSALDVWGVNGTNTGAGSVGTDGYDGLFVLGGMGGTGSITAGAGGDIFLMGGVGGGDGNGANTGGTGGLVNITGGFGGAGNIDGGTNGPGGSVFIQAGNFRSLGGGGGSKGNLILQQGSGFVGIGTATPQVALNVSGEGFFSNNLTVDNGINATIHGQIDWVYSGTGVTSCTTFCNSLDNIVGKNAYTCVAAVNALTGARVTCAEATVVKDCACQMD